MVTSFSKEIGSRIKFARESARISQRELAEKLEVHGEVFSQAKVWAIERGDQHLRAESALNISFELGVSIVWLLTGSDQNAHAFDQGVSVGHARGLLDAKQAISELLQGAHE